MIDAGTLRGKRLNMIDISQPISASTACFPGDVPFSRNITLSYEDSKVINLTSLTMSPHVGTHADAPVHVRGSMSQDRETAGEMPLEPFIGPATVIDLAPFNGPINADDIDSLIPKS